jgi:predicted Fe-Mo cluster-binding NifX family protein
MIIACATDDNKNFIERHFGDAAYYDIFELEDGKLVLLETISNTTEDEAEGVHGDPKKAKGIRSLLAEKHVNVGLTKVFGPNIKRIKKHLVPVLVSVDTIEEGLKKVLEASETIQKAIDAGDERGHIDLR